MKYDHPDAIWTGIIFCQEHPRFDEDCQACVSEVSARGARVEQMGADAAKCLSDLGQQGAQMPPWLPLEVRLDTLMDSIMRDPKDRMRYEGEVGRRLMTVIKDMQEQIKQPTLHLPEGVTPIRR